MKNKAYRDTNSTCRAHYKKFCNEYRYRSLEKEGAQYNLGFERKPYEISSSIRKGKVRANATQ